jgi:hypothetical protein
LQEIDSEKPGSAGMPSTSIIRHTGSMFEACIRRNARLWRFDCALRAGGLRLRLTRPTNYLYKKKSK